MQSFPDTMISKTILLTLTLALVFASVGYGPISVWAQENVAGTGMPTQGPNGTNSMMHNPCFPNGLHGHGIYGRHHHGNQTNYMAHPFGQNATWMRNGTHYSQYGNHTGFRMIPCMYQKPASTNYESANSTMMFPAMSQNSSATNHIPGWVRNNAKWWSQGQMGDSDFVTGMQYLVQQRIMKIPPTGVNQTSQTQSIPGWVKTNAKWWSQGQISDDDFIKGIQYLVSSGIVKVR
ncbi:MAG TPA: hypothetical protein VJ792_01110 [Candidatus Nitrosotalea sp.]|nr:hypothetical protein [Candidatus Nitrosotalea sp.]